MKNSTLERGGEVLGGMENQDPASMLETHLEGLFDDELEQSIIDLKRSIDASTAQLLVRVAELDRRHIPRTEHLLSSTQWLKRFCGMTPTEASGTLKTARALVHMPTITRTAITGDLVPTAVRLLAQARDRHPDEFADHEVLFADIATRLSVRDVKRAVSHWEQQVAYDEALTGVEDDTQVRELFFNQTYLGRWDMQGRFGVASGHVINTALRGYVQRTYLDTTDRRTMPQRLADAAIDIHQFWLDHNETAADSGGEKPHITVTVDYSILTGERRRLPELDGHTIDPETLRRWACDAGIVRILLDADSQPLDVGRRTRTIPPALRRALELRDGGCVWAGCDAPASWCDAHHIIHWADGGTTTLDNLILLCRKHHTAVHGGRTPPTRPSRAARPHDHPAQRAAGTPESEP